MGQGVVGGNRGNNCSKENMSSYEEEPNFGNKFHEYSHRMQFAIDVYKDSNETGYKMISESLDTNNKSGFAARTYDTGKAIVIAIRGTELKPNQIYLHWNNQT